VPTPASNRTTEFSYDGNSNMLTLKSVLPGSAFQTTQYVYGVSTASGSDLNSNDLLAALKYPDKNTGEPSEAEKETFTVNALGQSKTRTDRNGTMHTYGYDVVGRPTADAITTLGAGV